MIEPFAIMLMRAEAWQHADAQRRISVEFRCKLVLMIFNAFAFGDHVQDPRAFVLRARRLGYLVRELRRGCFSFEAWPLPREWRP